MKIVYCSCDEGYNMIGSSSTVCNEDASWSENPPICNPIPCGTPTRVKHAKFTSDSNSFGGTVIYKFVLVYTYKALR